VERPDHDERRRRWVLDLRAHTTGGGERGGMERWSNGDHRSGSVRAEVAVTGRSGGGGDGATAAARCEAWGLAVRFF
jgi:hypothetical protein